MLRGQSTLMRFSGRAQLHRDYCIETLVTASLAPGWVSAAT